MNGLQIGILSLIISTGKNSSTLLNVFLNHFSFKGFALKCHHCNDKDKQYICESATNYGEEKTCASDEVICLSLTYSKY